MNHYILNPNVKVLRSEGDRALVYHMGSRFVLKGPKIAEVLPVLLEILSKGIGVKELESVFFQKIKKLNELDSSQGEIFFEVKFLESLVKQLVQCNLVAVVQQGLALGEGEGENENFKSELFDFIQGIRGRSFSHSQFLQKAKNTNVGVICLLPGGKELEVLFKEMGVSFKFFSPEEVLSAKTLDIHKFILWGDWHQREKIRTINQFFYRKKQSWLLVLEDLFGGMLGPWFGQKDGPCYECFYQRRLAVMKSLDENEIFENELPNLERPRGPKVFSHTLAGHVAWEVFAEVFSLRQSSLIGGVIEFDFFNIRTRHSEIYPIPFCTTCSDILGVPLSLENDRSAL